MSISSTARKAGPYSGNGIAVAFPFAFKVFSSADVLVVKTTPEAVESTLVMATDYTVSLNADQDSNPGGTVTAVSAPASGTLLTITSAVENLQPVSLSNNGGFYPKVINDALDRLTILVQQVAEKAGRALTLPISGGGSGALPGPSAGSFIGWDSLGQNLVNYVGIAGAAVSTFMATVVSSANASAARTALGAVGTSDVQALSNKSLDATCSLDGNAATSTIAATADVATNGTQVGTIIDFSGTSAPSGYLACPVAQTDISRTTYAALFAAIGTTWGAGNGSTTFGMPWFPEGFASVQANANVGASVNGSIPSHNHAIVTVGAPGSGATTGMVLTGTGSAQGTITTYITAAGSGTENKAAGVKILKCVKY
jgi:hypothetical protein